MSRFPMLHGLAAAPGSSPALHRCGEGHSNPSGFMAWAWAWQCPDAREESRGTLPGSSPMALLFPCWTVWLEQLWSSSGAGRSGCETQALHCTSCSVQGRDRAGLAHTGISGAAGPLPCAAASGRPGEGWEKAGEGWKAAAGSVTAWGGLPPHSPCPGAGSSPSQCTGARGRGWGMCAGWGARVPTAGLARR